MESCRLTYTRVEAAGDLSAYRIHAADNIQVVDDDGRSCPPGQVGNVRPRTGGVDGYPDDPETSRAFFYDGFFHPGDLALVRDGGRVTLQGGHRPGQCAGRQAAHDADRDRPAGRAGRRGGLHPFRPRRAW